MNQDSFKTIGEVKAVRKVIEGLFPNVFQYQKEIAEKAYRAGFLDTPFGNRRYFWDVFHWDAKKQGMAHGADYEAAVAYRPASIAFGIKKDAMLKLEEMGAMDKFGFILDKHDALKFHCPKEYAEECMHTIHTEMQRPHPALVDDEIAPLGLWCEVEVKIGPNDGALEEVKMGREGIMAVKAMEDLARGKGKVA